MKKYVKLFEEFSQNTIQGRYLILTPSDRSLKISLTEEGKEELFDLIPKDELEPNVHNEYPISSETEWKVMAELFDDIRANSSWDFISAEEINALTDPSVIIIGDDVSRNDHGEIEETGNIYWDTNYALVSIISDFINKGFTTLQKA